MNENEKLDETNNHAESPSGMGFWSKVSSFFRGASCGGCTCAGSCGSGGCGTCGIMTLDKLEEGQFGKVVNVSASKACQYKLADLGLTPGVEVMVQERAPFGGPIMIRLRGSLMALRVNEAKHVEIAVETPMMGE